MGIEIERKYIVVDDGWADHVVDQTPMRQGYVDTGGDATVRVRIAGEGAVLTLKGPTVGLSRAEYEYDIPLDDARQMLDVFCENRQVQKVRYYVEDGQRLWEVDVFEGANDGLVLAEVELERPDQGVDVPTWVGREVSKAPQYRNASLAVAPRPQ